MSHRVVKLITNDDGDKADNDYWHFVYTHSATDWTLCTGEAFGFGDSALIFKEKSVDRGGVTCPVCIATLKYFKSIKL